MRITVLAHGSRGDVQPYLALSLGLQRAGHTVTLAAPEIFRAWIEGYGLTFSPLVGDPHALMQQAATGSGIPGPVRSSLMVLRYVAPTAARLVEDVRHACCGADAVIHSLLTTALGHQAAVERGIPDLSALIFVVFSATGEFPNPLFRPWPGWVHRISPNAAGWERVYNRKTHEEFTRVFWLGNRLGYRWLRRSHPDLPVITEWPFEREDTACPTPILYGISRHALPPPQDWSAPFTTDCRDLPGWDDPHPQLTGYWFLEAPPDYRPPAGLLRFLEAGPPPVYAGFGSLVPRDSKRLMRITLDALCESGQRAVIATGWSGMERVNGAAGNLPDWIYPLEEVPFDWLFQHVSAAIHHGGMGTTAAALRAGIPSVIVPFTFDQPFWGRQIHTLGAGPAPIPNRQLTAPALAEAIRAALNDESIRARAAQIGEKIRQEDGVTRAVSLINAYFQAAKNIRET